VRDVLHGNTRPVYSDSQRQTLASGFSQIFLDKLIIIIIIRNLYSAIMPLGGYRGAGGTGSRIFSRKQ